jgi:hypothetical protein
LLRPSHGRTAKGGGPGESVERDEQAAHDRGGDVEGLALGFEVRSR